MNPRRITPILNVSNIQDSFFNQIRKDRAFVTIYLVNGIKLTGKIRSFDKFTVILENKNQEQMIEVSNTVAEACAACHEVYRDTPTDADRCTPQTK